MSLAQERLNTPGLNTELYHRKVKNCLSQVQPIDIGALGLLFLLVTEQKDDIVPDEKWGKEDPHSPSVLGKSYCLSFS